jgi:hypothetical protein
MTLFKKIEQRPFLKKEFVPVPNICRDPNGDMIIACAIDAAADYIVSGDEDLLILIIPVIIPGTPYLIINLAPFGIFRGAMRHYNE